MKQKFLVVLQRWLFGLVLLSAAACSTKEQVQQVADYYPNGCLKIMKSMQDNQLHGRSRSYYPDGTLQSVSMWEHGRRTGVTTLYYANGTLRDSANYLRDSLNGPALRYYPNGVLKQRTHFADGATTGHTIFFDSLGKLVQRQIYNQAGKLIYLNDYAPDGRPSPGGMMTIIEAKDTLIWGGKYTGCVYFGYPLKSPATMLVGTLGKGLKASDRHPMVDTFQVVAQSKDGRFYFSYYPVHAGVNAMEYKFRQPGSPWDAVPRKDSLSVDGLAGDMPFFVRKPMGRQ